MMRSSPLRPALAIPVLLLIATSHLHAQPLEPRFVPGEVLIKFKAEASRKREILSALGASRVEALGRTRVERVQLGRLSVEQAIALYRGRPDVEYIEPNYLVRADKLPNDPRLDQLWGLRNVGQTGGKPGADVSARTAWEVTTGSPSVLVGVIDTGVDYTHPDLAANIWVNPAEIPDNGIDDDGNGYVDDVHGFDFANNDSDPMDGHGHGTHVSGTIGAVGNNGMGVVGVCWQIKIMALQFLSSGGIGTSADAIRAIDYATRMGARLTNNSWGGGDSSQAMEEAIRAAGDAGVLFVASAGNLTVNNDSIPHYPASYVLPNVVSVAATSHGDQLAGFSNYGRTTVHLGAPGLNIVSTLPGNSYGMASGTSMAAPHVSGALGLIFARYPGIDGAGAKRLLLDNVKPLPSLSGWVVTGGRLNALLPIAAPDNVPPAAVTTLATTSVNGSRLTLTWTAPGDDGRSGQVTRYEVRYATSPLDEGGFDAATRITGPLLPLPAGGTERIEVRGLSFGTTYYFAVKAADELENTAALSNLASATTLAPPEISVTPSSLSSSLMIGQSETQALTIRNSGPSELNYRLTFRSPHAAQVPPGMQSQLPADREVLDPRPLRDLAGPEIVRAGANPIPVRPPAPGQRFDAGRTPLRGPLAADRIRTSTIPGTSGLKILLIHDRHDDVSEIQTLLDAFYDVERVDTHNGALAVPSLETLAAYDGVIVISSLPFGDRDSLGDVLADYVDGGGTLVLTLASFINGFNVSGRLLTGGYVPFVLGFGPVEGSALGTYNAAHPIMTGVHTASAGLLGTAQLAPGAELVASWQTGEAFVATQGKKVAGVNVYLAIPGFWQGDVPLVLYNAILWGTNEARWLSADPVVGVVPAGSNATVALRLDATGLDARDYGTRILIQNDDPNQRQVEVPVRLQVGVLEPPVVARLEIRPSTLNSGGGGQWVHASLGLPAPYAPGDVLLGTVLLNGVVPPVLTRGRGDHDGDDVGDEGRDKDRDGKPKRGRTLELKFERTAVLRTLPESESATVEVTGTLASGRRFIGTDRIRVIRHHAQAETPVEPVRVFALLPAAPNPFRGTTRYAFDLPSQSRVRLAVFDIAGRVVQTLVQGDRPPGHYELEWNGRDAAGRLLPAGVYHYHLETVGFSAVRKLVKIE